MDKRIVVAALYIRNSDSSKMDTEVQKAQEEALRKYAKEKGYEVCEHLVFKEAVSVIKVPYLGTQRTAAFMGRKRARII